MQIIFSVIVALTNATPYDTEWDDASAAADDASENISIESNEHVDSPIGIFTKYADDDSEMLAQPKAYELPDEVRVRRKINEMHSMGNGSPEITVMDEENREEPVKVPLEGIIAAIETDLVTTALLANTQLHKRQSMEHENNASTQNDSIDANENLFEDLFNFTRPEEQTDGNENVVRIPLNGLVSAVESTLINSAQNLKDIEQLPSNNDAKHKINSNAESIGLHRIDRDTTGDVYVETLDGNKSLQNLSILSSIALKPVMNDTKLNTTDDNDDDGDGDDDDTISSTEYPGTQRTNLTVVQASDTVSVVSDGDDKPAHLQHQVISEAVFQSNFAIFPTIASESLATSPSTITSTQETSTEETNLSNTTNKNEQNHSQKTSVLREKIAEVQAPPVILSSFP